MSLKQRIAGKFLREIQNGFHLAGMQNLLLSKKGGAAILCYHGVDLKGDKAFNMRFYSMDSIESHFKLFKENFNVISVSDYFQQRFDASKFNIAITFDDGYRNNFKYLLPLVNQYQIPVSIFCTGINNTQYNFLWADFADIISKKSTIESFRLGDFEFERKDNRYISRGNKTVQQVIKDNGTWAFKQMFFEVFKSEFDAITKKEDLSDYWTLMSDEEIKSASESKFVQIGSHGYFHNNLGNVSVEDASNEMRLSKSYLENLVQKEVNSIAYPDGSYSRAVINEAEVLGFKHQLALSYLFNEDKMDSRIEHRYGMYPVYSDMNQVCSISNMLLQK